jgi:acyl-homoserine-lactone acylase
MRTLCTILSLILLAHISQGAALPAKSTEILWDRFGIPHIFAPDRASLFYAYGYAQMEAHSELLVRLYAQARGTAAEHYGREYLDSDRWVRVNGIPERALDPPRQSYDCLGRIGSEPHLMFPKSMAEPSNQ